MTMALIGVALLWLAGSCALLALAYRGAMAARWREPVLRAPVLIFESDDWGYGPDGQARALDRIAEALAAFRDRRGRHPVMTLGVVLAGPDTDRMRAEGCRTYHRVTLADPRLAPVREAMSRGAARGVFSLQLHGMEHFWPECLMRGAAANGPVRDWLTGPGFPSTEALPPQLQSRWIDATELPSKPLPVARGRRRRRRGNPDLRGDIRRAAGSGRAADLCLDRGRGSGVGGCRRPCRRDARQALREPRPGWSPRARRTRSLQRGDGTARRDRTSCATATSSPPSGIRIGARCRRSRATRISAAPRCSRSIG